MSDDWEFYPCRVDDRPASISFDDGLFPDTPQAGRPWLLTVRLPLRSPRPDGLPDGTEEAALGPWEERLLIALAASCDAVHVGRLQTDGARELFFYAPAADGFEAAVDALAPAPAGYASSLQADHDPGWRQYREFLYPGRAYRRWIEDRRIVDVLVDEGDPLDRPRPVDHWAYFPTAAQRDAFAAAAEAQGFAWRPTQVDAEAAPGAHLTRDDPVHLAHIHGVSSTLVRLAEAHGGEYDGWETPIVS